MSNENNEIVVTSNLLPVSRQAVEELKNQRELLSEFVRSQLKEADFRDKKSASFGEGDYGIIPGTKKRCLLKSGAEKLLRLYGLGVRFKQTDKELDRHANFALYTYAAYVFIVKTGMVVAECEATANSQEVKYKERTEWKTNEKNVGVSMKVETPIYDIINTLQKMAQKRALIGATLLATGASEYFTQDMLDPEEALPEKPLPVAQPVQNRQPPTEVKNESAVAPTCCGHTMMISKYVDAEFGHAPWYCMKCKQKLPITSEAS